MTARPRWPIRASTTIGTMIATDAPAAAALEAQLRHLITMLERLSWVRAELVPAKATFWEGEARIMYDRAVRELDGELDSVIEVVGYAQRNTTIALNELVHRA